MDHSWENRQGSYRSHSRPNGRPVHPACTFRTAVRRDQAPQPCSCDKLWNGWDGTKETLDVMISNQERRERRSKSFENSSDFASFIENDSRKGWDGFWSTAENLRCIRGKNFIKGNLDMRRFQSYTWERARESMK